MEKYDVILPLGPNCKPAFYVRKLGLRKCAYPFDWLTFGIEDICSVFENRLSDFFTNYKEIDEYNDSGCRTVVDTLHNMKAIHHVRKDIPIEDAIIEFRDLMIRRFDRLDNDIKSSRSVLILCNCYDKDKDTIKDFLIRFSKLYSGKKIKLINMRDSETDILNDYSINDNLLYLDYSFDDTHKDNDGLNWIGNNQKWEDVLSNYSS